MKRVFKITQAQSSGSGSSGSSSTSSGTGTSTDAKEKNVSEPSSHASATPAQIQELFNRLDTDKDGSLSRKEFMKMAPSKE